MLFPGILSVNVEIRLRQLNDLQKRTIVEREQIECDVIFVLHAEANRFIRNGFQFERTTNRFGELFERVVFQKSQYLDVLPCAEFFPRRVDESSTQDIEILR